MALASGTRIFTYGRLERLKQDCALRESRMFYQMNRLMKERSNHIPLVRVFLLFCHLGNKENHLNHNNYKHGQSNRSKFMFACSKS
ncbi:hypothetical protein P5673_025534 [Acropora cervicornis]|uniref:Uncharacterized protein n=1 Tax=Acropora cervicornis TaxID=6130 RepID=A0AAD9Q2C9_ACRCE|nr:hypothetical protein P5673_025534 [Acropora cervicornis]